MMDAGSTLESFVYHERSLYRTASNPATLTAAFPGDEKATTSILLTRLVFG